MKADTWSEFVRSSEYEDITKFDEKNGPRFPPQRHTVEDLYNIKLAPSSKILFFVSDKSNEVDRAKDADRKTQEMFGRAEQAYLERIKECGSQTRFSIFSKWLKRMWQHFVKSWPLLKPNATR